MNAVNLLVEDAGNPGVTPRRERVRAATEAEILATARALLVAGGPSSVTLREVGRRMGMTASALYRYYDGHGALLDALIASCFDELAAAVGAPGSTAPPGHLTRSEQTVHALGAAGRTFRAWSLSHSAEFGLMFGPQDPTWAPADCVLAAQAGDRFGQVFSGMFAQGIDVSKAAGDGRLFGGLPHPLDELFARAWMRLLGSVSVEVFGHTHYMAIEPDRLFELELADCGRMIGDQLAAH